MLRILAEEHAGAPAARFSGLLAQQLMRESNALSQPESQALAATAVREWRRAAARAAREPRVLQFFADDLHLDVPAWRKRLSVFCTVPALVVDGASYPSVEHYFQSAKYTLAGSERARAFETGGAVGEAPLAAKTAGARKAFEATGCRLDLAAWGALSDGVMWHALLCRACADGEFCAILLEVHAQGATLLHFERQGAQSYWGGNVGKASGIPQGRNRLGQMMMRLGARLAHDGGAEALRARCAPERRRSPEERLANWRAVAAALAAEDAAEARTAEPEPGESVLDAGCSPSKRKRT